MFAGSPLCLKFVAQRREDRLEEPVNPLARVPADKVACGVDEHERGPCAGAVRSPHGEVGVVDDGVFEPIPPDCLANAFVVVFIAVLARVHADHGERVSELLFEPLQVGDDVLAVDAPQRPEVEQHHFSAEVGQRERTLNVEPRHPAGEVGGRVFARP